MQHTVNEGQKDGGQMDGRKTAGWGGEMAGAASGVVTGRWKADGPTTEGLIHPVYPAHTHPTVLAAESHRGWQTGSSHTVGAHTEAQFLTHNRQP